ncbi:MAG: ribonucleoside-diphosphate reductase subunit alpha [Rickettsiales bacterium]|jgi:ribonucleoside-diphosphate reductase alpha chain|nr:ribonucleoside-diphosphate reductase subunit alpha [Rickettsiales bacterium]
MQGNAWKDLAEFAARGLDVNLSDLKLAPGAGVEDLISAALGLTDVRHPDWKDFAGRAKMADLVRQTALKRNSFPEFVYDDYPKYAAGMAEQGLYSPVLLEKYSAAELEAAGKFINKDYDFIYDYAGADLLSRRYLVESADGLCELPQEMFLTIALLLERNAEPASRMEAAKDTYEKLAAKKISLGTPFLMNLRRPEGNLSSCFVTVMDDSRDSIFYVIDQISAISKFGGGVGVNVSRVRCRGARIREIKNASGGVVPWIRIINDTAVAVNQQGKRKGAVTVSLDVWHRDIEDFLELRTENGDQRMKAYDIFPQVVVPDLFMRRAEENASWLLVDPNEVRMKYGAEIADLWGEKFEELYARLEADAESLEMGKTVPAKDILKRMMKSQVETGMPYIAFKDTLNRYNPNKHDGAIVGTNLCTESHSNVRPSKVCETMLSDDGRAVRAAEGGLVHVCNLASLNLAAIDTDAELASACAAAVRMLDNAIDFTECPVPEGTMHNRRYRTIGVGAMGLADRLAKNGILYSKSAEYVDDLFEKIALYNIRASIDIARKKGTFTAYAGSDWDRGIIMGRDKTWFRKNSKRRSEWDAVFEALSVHGIRNSQISAIAPNTSSSLIQGCTASVLPVYSKFFVETHGLGSVPNCPPFIKDHFWEYQESRNIDRLAIVDVVARISKWIDTGVSMELIYNLNDGIMARNIMDTIFHAWKNDIKTIYYTRTIQRDSSADECVSCAN